MLTRERKCCLVKVEHCLNPRGAIWEPGERASGRSEVGKVDKAMGSDCEVPIPFDVQGSVAKSTHAGLPWLRHLRRECKRSVHFWPFDGGIPEGSSVVAEISVAVDAAFPQREQGQRQPSRLRCRPTLDESRIRQKRKDEPASGAALQFSIGTGGAREDKGFLRVIKPSTSSPIGLFEYHSANSVTIPLHALASFLSLQYVFCLCSPPIN